MSNQETDKLFDEAIEWMHEYSQKNKDYGPMCPISIARALGVFIYHTAPNEFKAQAIGVTMQELCDAFNSGFEHEEEEAQ